MIDRVTASRLGIAPTTIDNTLYDAFGQRQINTMYTQVNQYHVILESDPQFQQDPDKLSHLYIQANASSGSQRSAAPRPHSPRSVRRPRGSNALTDLGALHALGQLRWRRRRMRLRRAARARANQQGAASAGATSSTMSNAVPLSAFAHFEKTTEPLSITHQGQFPAVTVSFNLAPMRRSAAAITAINKVQRDLHMPASLQAELSGHGRVVHELAVERAAADSGRAGHGLHRARRALRELHSSGHDSLDAAVGRRGRAAGADALRPGPERRRDHRHHPADRHREEERHHDGRLRARGRAHAGQEFDRRDLRGLPAALPPDHDDHDGRAARRYAAGARQRHRLGAAAAAGHCHGRRTAAQPGADALHDAGHLHLLRSPRATLRAQRVATDRRERPPDTREPMGLPDAQLHPASAPRAPA